MDLKQLKNNELFKPESTSETNDLEDKCSHKHGTLEDEAWVDELVGGEFYNIRKIPEVALPKDNDIV